MNKIKGELQGGSKSTGINQNKSPLFNPKCTSAQSNVS